VNYGHLWHLRGSRVLCCLVLSLASVELHPLSSDADEGCQWDVQTVEGWILYWDPQD
jgi:hypothetical protein